MCPQIKALSVSGLKVQSDGSLNRWGTFVSTVRQTWKQTEALFSRSLIFTTAVMLFINFAIQFGLAFDFLLSIEGVANHNKTTVGH